jgi:hypothetical protein
LKGTTVAFLFMDWETQSNLDLTVTGTLRYVLDPSTRVLLKSYAIDDEPVKLWCPDFGPELVPEVWAFVKGRMDAYGPPPAEIMTFFDTPGNYAVASNMGFDRQVWQQVATPENGFPQIEIEQTLCSQAQAQASNLSGSLDMAGRALGLGNKTVGGKAIMKRFADRRQPLPGSPADIERLMTEKGWSRAQALKISIEGWDLYLTYGVQDTELMRDVWKTTRQLDASEWQEYWVSERINDRGMLADLDVCRGAAKYHEEEAAYVVEQIKEITEGQIAGPTFTAQINEWVYDRLPDDLAEFMVKKRDEEGYVTNLTGDKSVMTRLLEEIQTSDTPPDDKVIDLIEVLQFGRSSSALKFQKILNQEVDGRLGGSYVFNGAGQTGRFCVARDTLIDTPAGSKPIVDLQIGDKVITHLGRPQPVVAVIYKGREQMYRLTASNGATITATAAHRLMTESGWKRLDECFDISATGPCAPRAGCTPVSHPYVHDCGDRGAVSHHATDSERNHSYGGARRGAGAYPRSESLAAENGRSQPDVREEDRGRADFAERSRGGVERERLHVRAPVDRGEGTGAGEPASTPRGAPYRRGQVEQPPGQSGDSDEARAPVSAQAAVWSLVPVGEGEVWDISVAGDASYSAQGLISHNSSRGVQVHNLPRAFLDNELDVLDMIAAGMPIEKLREIGPVSSVLSKLIRPTFIAPPGKLLVWGDWSAIEARVNPWLADSREAEQAVLTPFRESDADKSMPDVYILNAASIFNTPSDVIWERYKNGDAEAKGMRQAGKVAVLALGFLGSVGALKAMARGYGMRLTNEEAKVIVDGWRDRNKWARRFGDKCEAAAFAAMRHPMSVHPAGKLKYQYAPDLMGGTLVCFLPDMRPIVYPMAKIVRVEKFGKMTDAISYLNGMGRRNLWNGLQVENGTQATAASILRQTLVRLEAEDKDAETVLHTHDEVGGEVDETKAGAFAERLMSTMVRGWDWTEGLPLAAEVSTSWFYTKAA